MGLTVIIAIERCFDMRTITINKNDAGQRLDKFLTKKFRTMPKSLMYKYIRTKYIKLNGKKCAIDNMLKEGDVLTFYIKDEFFEAQGDEYVARQDDWNPIPGNKAPLFVNEPWLADRSYGWIEELLSAPYFVIIAMSF